LLPVVFDMIYSSWNHDCGIGQAAVVVNCLMVFSICGMQSIRFILDVTC
jgi:hypothetical protein